MRSRVFAEIVAPAVILSTSRHRRRIDGGVGVAHIQNKRGSLAAKRLRRGRFFSRNSGSLNVDDIIFDEQLVV